jgi:hypothetical protein
MTYDYDCDPDKRRETPGFYGFAPDDGAKRTVLFVSMMLNSSILLLVRGAGTSLLMMTDVSYFVYYLSADMGLYLAYKLVRGDFLAWAPIYGAPGLIISFFLRVIVKTVADYTGMVQLRGSPEIGGLYWTVNIVLALIFAFIAAEVYFAGVAEKINASTMEAGGEGSLGLTTTEEMDLEVRKQIIRQFLAIMGGAWIMTFAVVILLMKKKYRGSFFSTETGNEWAMSFFLEGETDRVKSKTLRLNKNKWKKIRPLVKKWVLENWVKWNKEEPEWLTENLVAKIDDDMIPVGEDRLVLVDIRRKSSIFGGGGGGRRYSASGQSSLSSSVVPDVS